MELTPGVEGLIHISQLGGGFVNRVEESISVGQSVQAMVQDVDEEAHRISLSIKALTESLLNPKMGESELQAETAFVGDEAHEFPPSQMDAMGQRFAPDPQSLAGRVPIIARLQRMGLSRRQWILLLVIGFFELVIMMIMVVLVLANTLYV